MPFAQWGRPVPRVIDGELVWVADGYLTSETFPLVERMPWRRGAVNSVAGRLPRRGIRGVRRDQALPPAGRRCAGTGLGDVAAGVVRPGLGLPKPVGAALPYPQELFEVQARALERSAVERGLAERASREWGRRAFPAGTGMAGGRRRHPLVALYERPLGRRISVVLGRDDARRAPRLQLVRLDTGTTLPAPRMLEETWNRFPSFSASPIRSAPASAA